MKVLFVASWYPTKKNPNFGIFIKEHARAINTTQNEIILLAIVIHRSKKIWSKKTTDTVDENGVRSVVIEISTIFRDLIYHAIPLQYCILTKVFQKCISTTFTPEIIHSNVIFPAGIIGSWLANKLKIPHVITEHWTRVRNFSATPILSSWAKKAYHSAFIILPVSKFLQNEIMESFGITNEKRFKVVANVIESTNFFYKDKQIHSDEIRLCAIATWAHLKNPAKQPELLINALSVLQADINQKIKLTMVGGGDKVDELKALCLRKNINATFTGYLDKTEIASTLQESDFFVHATLIETFGVVVAEALLTGTPVICSNVSALRELVTSENGELCENNVEDWVRGMKYAFSKKFDNEKIALEAKQKYDLQTIGKSIDMVYKELCN